MSGVIIDSWGIATSIIYATKSSMSESIEDDYYARYARKHPYESFLCWENLLTALVLWDNIYLNSERSQSDSLGTARLLQEALPREISGCQIESLYYSPTFRQNPYHVRNNEFVKKVAEIYANRNDCSVREEDTALLDRGTLYLMQANSMGISYLPHPLRAKALSESGLFSRGFDARIYLDIIDDEVRKYIDAINELAHFQLLSVSFPVLYKYISGEAKNPLDEFAVALRLRENKDIVEFRKNVNDINEELKRGNIHALRGSLMKVQEICNEITDSLYKKPLSYGVTIGLSPSIEISQDRKPKVSSSFHTTFLSDLANFALKGDIPAYYFHTN